ncbi:MAG: sialate O-acetylesterase [Verrucomicrobiota bacterium]
MMKRYTLIALGWIGCCCLQMALPEVWCADNKPIEKQALVFVITGESNSGGVGRNSNASPKEMAPRPAVQIMNLTDGKFGFEALQLGVNNLRDHFGLQNRYEDRHGFENELANAVERGGFSGRKQVHLIKTGHGGSMIGQWSEVNASGYWKKFLQRIEAGKKQVPANAQWVVWFSLGINDAIDKTPIELWEKETRAHIKKIQATLPGAIVVMTQFQAMGTDKKKGIYPQTDAAIARIAADEKGVYAVDSTGAKLVDKNHWSYEGLKTVVQRMVKITQQAILRHPLLD